MFAKPVTCLRTLSVSIPPQITYEVEDLEPCSTLDRARGPRLVATSSVQRESPRQYNIQESGFDVQDEIVGQSPQDIRSLGFQVQHNGLPSDMAKVVDSRI